MQINAIEEQLLFATVRIESLNDTGEILSIGTDFILFRTEEHYNKAYIISNKHVLLTSQLFGLSLLKGKSQLL